MLQDVQKFIQICNCSYYQFQFARTVTAQVRRNTNPYHVCYIQLLADLDPNLSRVLCCNFPARSHLNSIYIWINSEEEAGSQDIQANPNLSLSVNSFQTQACCIPQYIRFSNQVAPYNRMYCAAQTFEMERGNQPNDDVDKHRALVKIDKINQKTIVIEESTRRMNF